VIIGISILIFLHELGHFVAAKRCGVKVEAFALGFGPPIFSTKRGDTDYRLCWIPLGGYVKMAGESEEEGSTGAPDEFLSKRPGQRAIILASGVAMNALFAMVAFAIAFTVGIRFTTTKIGYVERGSSAWVERVEPGDTICKINGREVTDFEDLIPTIAFSDAHEPLTLEIERNGKRLIKHIRPQYDEEIGVQRLGVQPASTLEIKQIFEFEGKSPARDAGLRVYDRIVEANGPVDSWDALYRVLSGNPGKPVQMKVEREGKTVDLTVTPATTKRWMIGLTCQQTRIQAVRKESPAYEAGLRADDQIVSIKDQEMRGWSDLVAVLEQSEDREIPYVAKRGTKTVEGVISVPEDAAPKSVLEDLMAKTGLVIDSLVDDFPAAKIGLQVGDRVLKLEPKDPGAGKRMAKLLGGPSGVLEKWDDLHTAVSDSEGSTLLVTYEREGREYVAEITPRYTNFRSGGQIGITPRRATHVTRYGLLESIGKGIQKSIVSIKQVYLTIRGLATRRVAGKNVGGIVAIAQASYTKAKEGILQLLYLLGLISVQLAVLNSLPIPVLDGGHLFFLAVEKIKGSPVSRKIQIASNYVGLAILLTLVAYATRNDIMRLLS